MQLRQMLADGKAEAAPTFAAGYTFAEALSGRAFLAMLY
jgi:hypothetical protein